MFDNLFWHIFKRSGNIDAYIAYREFLRKRDTDANDKEKSDKCEYI